MHLQLVNSVVSFLTALFFLGAASSANEYRCTSDAHCSMGAGTCVIPGHKKHGFCECRENFFGYDCGLSEKQFYNAIFL